MFYLRRRTTVSWDQLRAFGSQYADTRSGRFKFRKDFERHLAAVVVVYRDADVEAIQTGLVLRPSKTPISATKVARRDSPRFLQRRRVAQAAQGADRPHPRRGIPAVR